ncbi:TRAP transporter substrate-binding protein [Paenibacillus alginolyticus]|uniref:TRAP transporter substrate-binding protein n=1 Tax=Paenibacillus alginolyticus TaxID=59839 RepID=A0ABT4GAN5_9BACL|nr:TRAP transporter substrate-binding protein [Paenibacillus alginolyticus]MCY9693214.1 TRAP transporter substrate-binding protein [Paenibacillus alginolyticus]MEC0146017.1 TRAP transporter substrate-binding protein [Paenibacillus alginolyticus]
MQKKSILLGVAICLILLSTGCNHSAGSSSESMTNKRSEKSTEDYKITIKFAHHMSDSSGSGKTIKKFADLVYERTNGNVQIELYSNGQLGGEQDVDENVMEGTIQMTEVSAPILGGLSRRFNVLNAPYLWESNESGYSILHGEVGKQLNEDLVNEKGLHILTWFAEGFRNVFAVNHSILKLEDWKGLKLRSPESDAYMQAFSALGANPTPLPWPQVYTALETNVVTAAEAPYDLGYTGKFYEVANDISTTQHIFITQAIVINNKLWKALPEDIRKVMQDAALDVSKEYLDHYPALEKEQMKKLESGGARIHLLQHEERERMAEAVKPVLVYLGEKYRITDLINQINQTKNK